jgi:hypothetical protein
MKMNSFNVLLKVFVIYAMLKLVVKTKTFLVDQGKQGL